MTDATATETARLTDEPAPWPEDEPRACGECKRVTTDVRTRIPLAFGSGQAPPDLCGSCFRERIGWRRA